MAVRLANRLETSRVLDFMQLSERINISKLIIPEKLVGKSVQEINFRSRFGLNIIAIENSDTVSDEVRPDYVFRANDILIVSGSRSDIKKLSE